MAVNFARRERTTPLGHFSGLDASFSPRIKSYSQGPTFCTKKQSRSSPSNSQAHHHQQTTIRHYPPAALFTAQRQSNNALVNWPVSKSTVKKINLSSRSSFDTDCKIITAMLLYQVLPLSYYYHYYYYFDIMGDSSDRIDIRLDGSNYAI